MHLLSGLAVLSGLASTGLAAASCPASATCKGLTALVASALKTYAPAQSFCTSKFPVPRQTCVSTAAAVTVTTTVATSTQTTTFATSTVTVTGPTSASTAINSVTATITGSPTFVTATVTVTTTSTVTVPVNAKRDNIKARAVDPRASQLSSLQKQSSAFVRSICTCVQTPAKTTATITPTTTLSVTATVTSSKTSTTATATITPSTTATVTTTVATSTVTPTSTTTTTTTTTVTTTTTLPVPTCPVGDNIQLEEGCNDGNSCNPPQTCYVVSSADGCATRCANDNCVAYSYDDINNNCVIYSDCCFGGLKKRGLVYRSEWPTLASEGDSIIHVKPGKNVTLA